MTQTYTRTKLPPVELKLSGAAHVWRSTDGRTHVGFELDLIDTIIKLTNLPAHVVLRFFKHTAAVIDAYTNHVWLVDLSDLDTLPTRTPQYESVTEREVLAAVINQIESRVKALEAQPHNQWRPYSPPPEKPREPSDE
jgi:hypothetical protein